jgi:hypothetical protein
MPTLLHFLTRGLSVPQTLITGRLSHLSGGPHEDQRKSVPVNILLKNQFVDRSLKLLDDFDFIVYHCHSL